MTLTIAIPTFDRAASLQKVLERLGPQIRDSCRILVLDNASPRPASSVIAPIPIRKELVQIVRHRVNIGAHANIHRAIELAQTEWIWILGDDDLPTADAVDRIMMAITEDQDATFINFTTTAIALSQARPRISRAVGIEQFADALDLPGNLNFMSSSVWRVGGMLPYLRLAYHRAYSMSWVFAFLFPALAEGAKIVLRPEPIIETVSLAPYQNRWSNVDFVLGYSTVLEAPMPLFVRKRIARKMLAAFGPEQLAAYVLAALNRAERGQASWTYRLVSGRLASYFSFSERLRLFLYRALFSTPRLSWFLVRAAIRGSVSLGWKSVRLGELEARSAVASRL